MSSKILLFLSSIGGDFPAAYLNTDDSFSLPRNRVKEKRNTYDDIECACNRCVLTMVQCFKCTTFKKCMNAGGKPESDGQPDLDDQPNPDGQNDNYNNVATASPPSIN